VIGHRPAEGKGRPPRLFGPSKKSLGNNLDLLSSILLHEIREVSSPERKETFIEHVAERLLLEISSWINQYGSEVDDLRHKDAMDSEKYNSAKTSKGVSISLSQRLYRTIHDLNRFHYYARWEAHVESPRVILGHCPYLGVPNEYPEICQVDKILLAGLLHSDVEQIARLAKDERGVTSCVFRVRTK